MSVLRWGICSAGKISFDFCVGLSTLPESEHQIVAVAARQLDRAQEFANKFDIPQTFSKYEDLAKCAEVDVVYIGALNPQHLELCLLMLKHGKHVLCEKPLCLNRNQAEKVIKFAEEKKLFLMEAVWSRFFPAYQYVKQQIKNKQLGEIQEVIVNFGFDLMGIDRLQKKELGGGVILDLGVYTIQLLQWVFQEPPLKVIATGELNQDKVDIDVKVQLLYANNRIGKMHISAKTQLDNSAIIKGTKGQIKICDNFWCPTKIIDIDGKEKLWTLPKGRYACNFTNSEGLRYEAEATRQTILAGQTQNENVTHNDTLLFAQIQDDMRIQVGAIFSEDNV